MNTPCTRLWIAGAGLALGACTAQVEEPYVATQELRATQLPARVQAQDYRRAYETTHLNFGAESAPQCDHGDGVDLGATDFLDGQCNIAWTSPGEWVEYKVKVPKKAIWEFALNVGTQVSNRQVRVELDPDKGAASKVLGTAEVPVTSWHSYATVKFSAEVAKGNHVVRVLFPRGLVNLNFFDATIQADPGVEPTPMSIAGAAGEDLTGVSLNDDGTTLLDLGRHIALYRPNEGWGAQEPISPEDGSASSPCLRPAVSPPNSTINSSGQVTTIYTPQCEPGQVFVRSRTSEGAWLAPTELATIWGYEVSHMAIGHDSAGQMTAIWNEDDEHRGVDAVAARFLPDTGWAASARVPGGIIAKAMHIAPAGEVSALWQTAKRITYSAYDPDADSWQSMEMISPTQPVAEKTTRYLSSAMDKDGNLIVLLREHIGDRFEVWVHYRSSALGWLDPTLLGETSKDRSAGTAINDRGEAIVAWIDMRGGRESVRVQHFSPDFGWSTSTEIFSGYPGEPFVDYPALGAGLDGNFVAAWQSSTGLPSTQTGTIWLTRFAPERSWDQAQAVTSEGRATTIATNGVGQALLVWTTDDGELSELRFELP